MSITAIHGDGARRIRYEYRPTTWIRNAVFAAAGIDGRSYQRGWRWTVQKAVMNLQNAGRRWV
jgi:hypothetical protein